MQAPLEKERLHRFVRRALERPFYPTERDTAVLLELCEARFLHTGQLQTLFGRWIDERLTLLYKAGYVDRPKAQWVWRRREGGGSKPLVYSLAQRGYELLRTKKLVKPSRRDFSERNRDLSAFSSFMTHELAIGDVRVTFRRACAIRSFDLLPAAVLTGGQNTPALSIPGRDKLLYPDWTFAIRAEGGEPSLFFVELDCVTEPNLRYGSDELQSLERKYDGYLAYARAKRHVEQFGVTNFRVLTVTTGEGRKVTNVAKTAGEVCSGVGIGRFLVTSLSALTHDDVFAVPWLDANGREVRLGV